MMEMKLWKVTLPGLVTVIVVLLIGAALSTWGIWFDSQDDGVFYAQGRLALFGVGPAIIASVLVLIAPRYAHYKGTLILLMVFLLGIIFLYPVFFRKLVHYEVSQLSSVQIKINDVKPIVDAQSGLYEGLTLTGTLSSEYPVRISTDIPYRSPLYLESPSVIKSGLPVLYLDKEGDYVPIKVDKARPHNFSWNFYVNLPDSQTNLLYSYRSGQQSECASSNETSHFYLGGDIHVSVAHGFLRPFSEGRRYKVERLTTKYHCNQFKKAT